MSEEEFEQAQQVLESKAPKVTHPRQAGSVWTLSRMLKCRRCGASLIIRSSKNGTSRFYQCRTRRHEGVETCDCPNLNALKLDERFLDAVLEDILCPSNVESAIQKMSEELTAPYGEQKARLQVLEKELLDIEQRKARVMEAYEKGAYSVDDYARRTAQLREAEAGLRQTIAETSERLGHEAAVVAGPGEVLEFTADVAEFIRNSSPKERKSMLQRFIKCVWIEPGKGTVEYRIPLPKDAKRSEAKELALALEGPVPPTGRLSPPPRAVGHTFEYTFPLPKPNNAGGGPPAREKKSRKENRKPTPNSHPKKTTPPRRPEPTPAEVEAKHQERQEYDRQRSQTPERKEYRRLLAQEKRQKTKSLGLCRDCPNAVIPNQTRCETCAAKHQASRSRRTAKENAAVRHSGQGTMF